MLDVRTSRVDDASDLGKGLQAECFDDCHEHSGSADHTMLTDSPTALLLYTCCM
jgi:hypothetical protein